MVCRLQMKLNGEWITKMDVGGPSEQPDEGDRRKAAFSDALKRAAVKFGIGRYLYRQEAQWVDYDTQKKKFAKPPRLPASAMPKKPVLHAAPEAATPPSLRGAEPKGKKDLPGNGEELRQRLHAYDGRLVTQGLCNPGDLVKHVVKAGTAAGHDADMTGWNEAAIALAVEETRRFEGLCRQKKGNRKEVA